MLYHQGTNHMEAELVYLRPFMLEDAEAMYRNWASDEKTVEFMVWSLYKSEAQVKSIVKNWVSQYEFPTMYHWAIVLKEINEPIGSISVARMDENMDTAEIGYCIGSPWWGEGYTTEALGLVVNYLFGEVGLHRIEAKHDIDNVASGKVQLKVGMLRDGVLRGGYKRKDGTYHDMVVNGITREEWEVM